MGVYYGSQLFRVVIRLPSLVTMTALIHSDLPGLPLISKGKVRDIYSTSSADALLFVASDRISAYDVILQNVRSSPLSFPHTQPE